MLRNDADAEGDTLDVTNATENDANFTMTFNGEDVTATRSDADNTKDFTYTVSDGRWLPIRRMSISPGIPLGRLAAPMVPTSS